MRELDLNNVDKQKARMSVYQHYDDLEKALEKEPDNEMLLKRLRITSMIVANIGKLF